MVEYQSSKLMTRVRFPSSAPLSFCDFFDFRDFFDSDCAKYGVISPSYFCVFRYSI